jgi:hypothetical protein
VNRGAVQTRMATHITDQCFGCGAIGEGEVDNADGNYYCFGGQTDGISPVPIPITPITEGPGPTLSLERRSSNKEQEENEATTASSHLTVLSKAAHSGPSACDSEREPHCPFAASHPKQDRAGCSTATVCRILRGI